MRQEKEGEGGDICFGKHHTPATSTDTLRNTSPATSAGRISQAANRCIVCGFHPSHRFTSTNHLSKREE